MKRHRIPLFLWHLLIILWAVALALLVLALVGTSNILSNLFGQTSLSLIVEISFFVLSGIFALLLWRFFSFPKIILYLFRNPKKIEYKILYNRSSLSRSILTIFTCAHYILIWILAYLPPILIFIIFLA